MFAKFEPRISSELFRALGVAGEEHAFRTQHFLVLENKCSMFQRSTDKRHHPLGLRIEERLPDSQKSPALRSHLDKVVRFSFLRRSIDLLSVQQNM